MKDPSVNPGYEPRDARAKPLALFAVGLMVLTAVSLLVSSWILDALSESREARTVHHPMTRFREAPDEPVLQADPSTEVVEHARSTSALLERYDCADPENGIVRIPIERAMEILVREGLPARRQEEGR